MISPSAARLRALILAPRVIRSLLDAATQIRGTGHPGQPQPRFQRYGGARRFRLPCPVCGTPVQRIRYADNEPNYCPHCQTNDRLLADRALSRLLEADWPKTLERFDRES